MARPRGTCSVCHQSGALSGFAETLKISQHGPPTSRCEGSGKTPGLAPAPTVRIQMIGPTLTNSRTSISPSEVFWPGQTIRTLPTALITLAAESLTQTLQSVCNSPDSPEAWTELITWAKRRLIAPTNRIGRAALKRLLREQLTGEGADRRDRAPLPVRRNQALARAVRSRVDVGDIRGASRIVVNDGKLVDADHGPGRRVRHFSM